MNMFENLRKKFNDVINKTYLVFGDKAFRRYDNKSKNFEHMVNRAILDFILIGFECYSIEKIENKKKI
ncbi:hypothetical protein PL321_14475 [Caloramator sp. mosi_1]|uniref:hypothetical protein n=1 Tax=Caloramator sp. mosi_1 TaxID=3023090 RepID=UPI00235E05D3|nr:hypothetical protein [Caloramator sp. mosi_1]WDC83742.1 hypothetical protein PL321_14475 [Caloramator sp. mosi_1]